MHGTTVKISNISPSIKHTRGSGKETWRGEDIDVDERIILKWT